MIRAVSDACGQYSSPRQHYLTSEEAVFMNWLGKSAGEQSLVGFFLLFSL